MPKKDSLDYDNYLVVIMGDKKWIQFNLCLARGSAIVLKANCELTESQSQPENTQVKRFAYGTKRMKEYKEIKNFG